MAADIVRRTDHGFILSVEVAYGDSMLDAEEAILLALNEAGVVATEEALRRFDADGQPIRLAGRIDRLVVAKGRVLVVDYKSDANPPQSVSGVSASYLTQVGLYAYVAGQLFPGRAVDAAILWTSLESLMILPPGRLRQAVSGFTIG